MKKLNFAIMGILMFTMAFSLFTVFGADLQPGSETDPLVSKSYVDQKINEALNSGTNKPTSTVNGAVKYVPVNVPVGNILVGHEGTEIILRSGSAVAHSTGQNGLTNITIGKEVFNGEKLELNNMLIVPRYDGRGVKTTTDAWFMIKGGYDVTPAAATPAPAAATPAAATPAAATPAAATPAAATPAAATPAAATPAAATPTLPNAGQ